MEILKEKKSKFIWSWAISNLLDSLIVEYGCIIYHFYFHQPELIKYLTILYTKLPFKV